jgi:hypothetical protein
MEFRQNSTIRRTPTEGDQESPRGPMRTKRAYPIRVISFRRIIFIIGCIIALWIVMTFISGLNSWKAVFIDNNQVYFGKFINIPFTSTINLKHVYYLKSAATSTDFILSSPQNDVHQPESNTTLMKEHVLYYQKLSKNSALLKAIRIREGEIKDK